MLNEKFKKMDTKELDLPDTVYIRDIDNRVFQQIALECLSKIEGVSLLEGNLIDSFLGREGAERLKGISIEQDEKNHSVKIKVEINVLYGTSLPEKAEEIQTKIAFEVSKLTALHVAAVHVVFKNMISKEEIRKSKETVPKEEYTEEF
jgi:uncharacterized alkaline shock family protein YloU